MVVSDGFDKKQQKTPGEQWSRVWVLLLLQVDKSPRYRDPQHPASFWALDTHF